MGFIKKFSGRKDLEAHKKVKGQEGKILKPKDGSEYQYTENTGEYRENPKFYGGKTKISALETLENQGNETLNSIQSRIDKLMKNDIRVSGVVQKDFDYVKGLKPGSSEANEYISKIDDRLRISERQLPIEDE